MGTLDALCACQMFSIDTGDCIHMPHICPATTWNLDSQKDRKSTLLLGVAGTTFRSVL